jgi:hypothetical protein
VTQPRTVEGWLIWLDQQDLDQADWSNTEWVSLFCGVMITCIPRRMGQIFIDNGLVADGYCHKLELPD